MRPFAHILIGVIISLPIWFGVQYAADLDAHHALDMCRQALSLAVEGMGE